jgi:hypothetical protein
VSYCFTKSLLPGFIVCLASFTLAAVFGRSSSNVKATRYIGNWWATTWDMNQLTTIHSIAEAMSDKRTSTFSGAIFFAIPVNLHDMLRQLLQFLAASDGTPVLLCGKKQCCPVLLCLSVPVCGVLEKLAVFQGLGDQRATSLVQARVLIAQAKASVERNDVSVGVGIRRKS